MDCASDCGELRATGQCRARQSRRRNRPVVLGQNDPRTWAVQVPGFCRGRRTVGGGRWSKPELLATNPRSSAETYLAVDGKGTATAVWSWARGGAQTSLLPRGRRWQKPRRLVPSGTDAKISSIAENARGEVVAGGFLCGGQTCSEEIWTRSVYGRWTHTALQSTVLVNTGIDDPRVAIDGHGDVVAVWTHDGTSASEGRFVSGVSAVFATARPAGGRWSRPVALCTPCEHFGWGSAAQVVIDSQGNATAIWEQWPTAAGSVIQTRELAGGVWQPTQNLASDSGNYGATDPQIGIDGSGNVTALWAYDTGPTGDTSAGVAPSRVIQSTVRPSGGTWQTPVTIGVADSSPPPGPPYFISAVMPELVVNSRGAAVAVWQVAPLSGPSAQDGVYAAQRSSAGWQPAAAITAVGCNGPEQVALNDLGDAVLVYGSGCGTSNTILGITSNIP